MAKIRKQTYSLDQYLKLIKAETIRSDADCQRLSGQWNNNMAGELIATVLTDNYIPPVILGEETVDGINKFWLIDGLQRSSTLAMFRYGNTKIAKNIDEFMVTYQRKILDGNGKPKRDEKGEIMWEAAGCDIRNKTYDQLPEELKEKFAEYQIETAIHQNCNLTEISKYVRKYNNHVAMNTVQKAFTYVDSFAREIRRITENRFFSDVYSSSQRGRINGTFERICGDIVLLCNYPNKYRKDTKLEFKWLNENAALCDFENVDSLLTRLTASIEPTKENRALFNGKNTSVFVTAFNAFTETGRKDKEFGDFLKWFLNGGSEKEIDGKTWETLDISHSTRDSSVVHGKIEYLEALIAQYIGKDRKTA